MLRYILFGLFAFSVAQAEDCGPLESYGTVPLTQIEGSDGVFVPVEINGQPKLLLLDTGSERPMLTPQAAKELGLRVVRTDSAFYDLDQHKSALLTETSLKLAKLSGSAVNFWITPSEAPRFSDPRVAGVLGMDVLRRFDLSIDFGGRTLTLFGPNHCEGHVAYWKERPITPVDYRYFQKVQEPHGVLPPMDRVLAVFPVVLDGVEMPAVLKSGSDISQVEHVKAEGKLDLQLGTSDTPAIIKPKNDDLYGYEVATVAPPGFQTPQPPKYMIADGKSEPGKTVSQSTYTHRFKSLSLPGIAINNPEVHIIPDVKIHRDIQCQTGNMMERERCSKPQLPFLRLGMNVLRHLRIYIAVKEKRVYISPASTEAIPSKID